MAYASFSRGYKSAATTTKIQTAGLPRWRRRKSSWITKSA